MWPGRPGIVNDSCIRLHPGPAAAFCQKSIIFGRNLALVNHCAKEKETEKNFIAKIIAIPPPKPILTDVVWISHWQNIRGMNILVECLFNQVLRFVASQLGDPRTEKVLAQICQKVKCEPLIQKNQLQVHTGAKHKHILVQFDFGDGRRRQWVSDGDEAQILN